MGSPMRLRNGTTMILTVKQITPQSVGLFAPKLYHIILGRVKKNFLGVFPYAWSITLWLTGFCVFRDNLTHGQDLSARSCRV